MAISKEDILELISNLSALKPSKFVKEFEKKFGVSAASVMVADDAVAGGAAVTAEEKTELDIVLVDGDVKKIGVIKIVRALAGLGLKEAEDAVEQTPLTPKEGVAKADAEEAKKQLEKAGTRVELK